MPQRRVKKGKNEERRNGANHKAACAKSCITLKLIKEEKSASSRKWSLD